VAASQPATDPLLGTEKWGAGLTAVVLTQQSGWTVGILANHIWSYAGEAFAIVLRDQERCIGLELSHLSECLPTDGGAHIAAAQQARRKAFRETTSEGLLWKKVQDGASCARRR
jgi:hypothetical protein